MIQSLHFSAILQGPEDSPYEGGAFQLDITIPTRYPFEPPAVQFYTSIYHPNIDSSGRICLDTLKMQPHGSWSPSVNISTLLLTIRLLLSNPNAEDGLVPDVSEEYAADRELFNRKARAHTQQCAKSRIDEGDSSTPQDSKQMSHTKTVEKMDGDYHFDKKRLTDEDTEGVKRIKVHH